MNNRPLVKHLTYFALGMIGTLSIGGLSAVGAWYILCSFCAN